MKLKAFKREVKKEINNIEIKEMSDDVKSKAIIVASEDRKDEYRIRFSYKQAITLAMCTVAIFLIAITSVAFFTTTNNNNIFIASNIARPVGSKTNLKRIVNNPGNFSFDGILYSASGVAKATAEYTATPENAMDENDLTNSQTIAQVEGIQESEIIKCDNNHIYYAYHDTIEIYEVDKGKTNLIKTIKLSNCLNENHEGYAWADLFTDITMYITDNNLLVMYEKPLTYTNRYSSSSYMYWYIEKNTVLEIYDKEEFNLVKSLTVPGNIVDGRVYNDFIYFITSDAIIDYEIGDILEKENGEDKVIKFDYDDVMYVPEYVANPYENYICSINLNTLEANYECQLGDSSYGTIYMSENAMYLCGEQYEYRKGYHQIIYKYIIDGNGFLKYDACGKIDGRVLNQYFLDEYNGYLRIVTTGRFYDNSFLDDVSDNLGFSNAKSQVINAVYVLKEKTNLSGNTLEVVSVLNEGIGYPGEEIKSVKFNKDYVSIVTYYQTDPLYLIKFTDDINIEIVDYLKVPGYSKYLLDVNINDKAYKIGVGVTDNGDYKISLYQEENDDVIQVGNDFVVKRSEIIDNTHIINSTTIESNIRTMFLYQDNNGNTFIGFNLDVYKYVHDERKDVIEGKYIVIKVDLDSEDALVKVKEFDANSYSARMVAIDGYYYLVSYNQALGYKYNTETNDFDLVE